MAKNIGFWDRLLRFIFGILLLIYAWWQGSILALLLALFTFYEAAASWCIVYQFLGKTTCPIEKNPAKKRRK